MFIRRLSRSGRLPFLFFPFSFPAWPASLAALRFPLSPADGVIYSEYYTEYYTQYYTQCYSILNTIQSAIPQTFHPFLPLTRPPIHFLILSFLLSRLHTSHRLHSCFSDTSCVGSVSSFFHPLLKEIAKGISSYRPFGLVVSCVV